MKLYFVLVASLIVSVALDGCSQQPPVPDPAQIPIAQQIDAIQKDPTLSFTEKQQKITALQNKR